MQTLQMHDGGWVNGGEDSASGDVLRVSVSGVWVEWINLIVKHSTEDIYGSIA